MSPLARGRVALAGVCLALSATIAPAQTIADYSRMQRDAIDKAMAVSASRPDSRGLARSVPASASMTERSQRAAIPSIGVSGVFSSASRAVAEVVVDGRAWMLSAGEAVPGTRWRVDVVAADRVVLEGGRGVRRTFALAPVPGGRR